MNVFLAGWTASGPLDDGPARTALARLRPHLTFAGTARSVNWRSPTGAVAVHCIAHSAEALGGVDPWCFEPDRMAFFCGRPILWSGDSADGAEALDATRYLGPAPAWIDALDGRFAILTVQTGAGGDELLVYPDPLGSYPVFSRVVGRSRWVSNNAALLAMCGPTPSLSRLALASVAGCGWSLGGDSAWEGVERLRRGSSLRISRAGMAETPVLPTSALADMFRGGWDPDRAAGILRASVGAAAGWPGRPTTLSLTGGRDSRVVFAAAVRSGAAVLAETGTERRPPGDETLDVSIARRLCEITGTPHHLNVGSPTPADAYISAMASHPYLSHGVVSMSDVLLLARPETLKVRLTGHGGELARVTHLHPRRLGHRRVRLDLTMTAGAAAASLFRNSVKFVPRPILSRDGHALVRGRLHDWARERIALGVRALDLGTMFYLEERMANWAAPIQTMYEYAGDTFSPLWSRRLLPDQLGCPAQLRLEGAFAAEMVGRLAPELAGVPYESELARRSLPARGRRFLEGRLRRRGNLTAPRPSGLPSDGLRTAVLSCREAILDTPRDDAAWDVLDRPRVLKILTNDPASLDARARRHFWRAVTVFSPGALSRQG